MGSLTYPCHRNPTVWINDAWCAQEIFEKKAQIYASRPRMVVFGELGTGQANLVTMRIRNQEERDHWRIHRKLMHIGVGVQSVRGYREIQNNESKIVAYDFIRDPKEYVKHLERYATSVVSIIAFGRRVASYNDPIITEVIALMQLAADLNVPGKSFPMLLETFPCKHLIPQPPGNIHLLTVSSPRQISPIYALVQGPRQPRAKGRPLFLSHPGGGGGPAVLAKVALGTSLDAYPLRQNPF